VQNVVFAEVRLENRRALTGGRTEHFITKEVRPVVTCIRIADKEHFSSCNRELWPVTLTFKLDPDTVEKKIVPDSYVEGD